MVVETIKSKQHLQCKEVQNLGMDHPQNKAWDYNWTRKKVREGHRSSPKQRF